MSFEENYLPPNQAHYEYLHYRNELAKNGIEYKQVVIPIYEIFDFVDETLNGLSAFHYPPFVVIRTAFNELITQEQNKGTFGVIMERDLQVSRLNELDGQLIHSIVLQTMLYFQDLLFRIPLEKVHYFAVSEEGRHLMLGMLEH